MTSDRGGGSFSLCFATPRWPPGYANELHVSRAYPAKGLALEAKPPTGVEPFQIPAVNNQVHI
jgi:hypothetical protein